MINEESRKYFNRAFLSSGSSLNYFAFTKGNHVERMFGCSEATNQQQLMEYLKTTPQDDIVECYFRYDQGPNAIKPVWTPTIEIPDAKMPFLLQDPEEIYNSGTVAPIDVLIGFDSQVTFSVTLAKNLILFRLERLVLYWPNEHSIVSNIDRKEYCSNWEFHTELIR